MAAKERAFAARTFWQGILKSRIVLCLLLVLSASTAWAAPTISSFTPNMGPVGTSVTITGTNYSTTKTNNTVKFNGTVATVSTATTTQLVVTVPSGAKTGKITVTVGSSTATSSSSFTVTVPPTITSFDPSIGPVGISVTITGTHFSATAANNNVKFNGATATVSSASQTQLVVAVPSGASTGPISVTTGGATATSSTDFTVSPLPTISTFSPTSGTVGTLVTITGTNFSTTPTENLVSFNGTWALASSANATQLVVEVPNFTTTGPVTVSVHNGQATGSQNFIILDPTVTSFTPQSGASGTDVTITGTNFSPETSFNQVTIGGYPAAISSATDTQIVASVLSCSVTGPICVTVDDVQACSTDSFAGPSAAITGFSPTSGYPGTTVTITGVNFNNNTVSFGEQDATPISATTTQLVVKVPNQVSGTVTGPLGVYVDGCGVHWSNADFTIVWANVTSFSPTNGSPGTSVTINGTGFDPTAANNSVAFCDASTSYEDCSFTATVTSASSTQLVVTVPSGDASSGPICVRSGGSEGCSSDNFTVVVPPTIFSFSPASGPTGTQITIIGTNFDPMLEHDAITVNGVPALLNSGSPGGLVATVQNTQSSAGPICVQVNGISNVCSSNNFTVAIPPVVTSFTPTSGPPGTQVTLNGTNLSSDSAQTSVSFSGTPASLGTATLTQIVTTVPSGATSGPITVNVGGLIGTTSSSFTVNPPLPPTITGFNPSSGPVGTPVTITGTNFDGVTETNNTVSFNGVPAVVTSASATQLVVAVPQGATSGPITVAMVGGQTAQSSNSFTVTAPNSHAASVTITGVASEPSLVGQTYTVTVAVNSTFSPAPTGTITIADQNGDCTINLPATSCTMPGESAVGEVSLVAGYSGDANYGVAVSSVVEHIVNPTMPTEMCGLDPWATPSDPSGFVSLTQLSGIVYTPGITQDITGNGALSVTIVSPSAGNTTAATTVDVSGAFVGPTNTGITVNGVLAYTANGQFLAPNVPLTAGVNTLTVTANTLPGATATVSTTITSGGTSSSPLTFTVDSSTGASTPVNGFITFDVAVDSLPNNATVQSMAIDADGNGTFDLSSPSFTSATFSYGRAGLYTATLRVVDSNGNTYLAYRPVLIQDPVAQRNMLCDVYAYLKDRLNAQDATGASNAYQSLIRSQYQQQFAAFGAGMPTAASMLGNIVNGRMSRGYADLTLVRDNTNQTRSGYPLRITQGGDGVWRISEM